MMIDKRLIAELAAMFRSPEDDAKEMRLTKEEAIIKMCALMALVRARLNGPADCFCPGAFEDPTGYRNDGRAIEFMEKAVRAALAAVDTQEVEE